MKKFVLLISALALCDFGHAQQHNYPQPSADLVALKTAISNQIKEIDKMGKFCDGGGRKWNKIESLELRFNSSPAFERLQSQTGVAKPCLTVAQAGGKFDPHGTVEVIPQRVKRLAALSPSEKQTCMQYFADYFALDKIRTQQVLPILNRFDLECAAAIGKQVNDSEKKIKSLPKSVQEAELQGTH